MKIVADEQLPLIKDYFAGEHTLLLKPGRAITNADVRDADAIFIRSVTPVNQALLQNTAVKFVGSAVSGTDHLALDWLQAQGIFTYVAAGCNAQAVAEYVVTIIAALQQAGHLMQKKPRAAVIGVGEVGQRVVNLLKLLGFDILQCDPLRAMQEPDFSHTAIVDIKDVDLITLHTPLITAGPYPTYHLINKDFLQRQKKNTVIINTSRGAVISTADLKQYGNDLIKCLDVFEHEPAIDLAVVADAFIATPHIAGYTIQSRKRAALMVYQAAEQFGIKTTHDVLPEQSEMQELQIKNHDWRAVVLSVFNPSTYSQYFKDMLNKNYPEAFDQLRKEYNSRNEFAHVRLVSHNLPEQDLVLLQRLGFELFGGLRKKR